MYEAIKKEFPDAPIRQSENDFERSYHMHFVEDKSRFFIGREVCVRSCFRFGIPSSLLLVRGGVSCQVVCCAHVALLSYVAGPEQDIVHELFRHCDSGYLSESLPLVVVGAPGSGKTSLMAAFAKRCAAPGNRAHRTTGV